MSHTPLTSNSRNSITAASVMGSKGVGMTWWADALLSLWVLFVAVIYFGGFFLPAVGALTAPAGAGYAAMLLISIGAVLARRLGRSGTQKRSESSKMEDVHG